jgi:hypothetical protein
MIITACLWGKAVNPHKIELFDTVKPLKAFVLKQLRKFADFQNVEITD